jgi:hypothetical protein
VEVVVNPPLLQPIPAADARSHRGVFETAPSLSLHLLIDIKTDGPSTFDKLYEVLQPLRTAGYLTTWSSSSPSPVPGPLTIIGTGDTPLASVQALGHAASRPRDIFLDAVLDLIPQDKENTLNRTVCPLASSDFQKSVGASWTVPAVARPRIRRLVEAAHERGIQARFWHTPGFPVLARCVASCFGVGPRNAGAIDGDLLLMCYSSAVGIRSGRCCWTKASIG